ncbi:hypothetical protein Sjap_007550 [Stephania japonica]|uniref:NAC domain-containing protein n=1 Tax=Stephania japonica TaxID=461633 RepID=A0AAP0JMT5_9MAGN
MLGVGYRFIPTDYELICYLIDQVQGFLQHPISEIIESDKVYCKEPWNLRHQLERENRTIDEVHMYFFVEVFPRERRAGKGYWHASSGVNKIFDPQSGQLVGETRGLAYYYTPSKNTCLKTNWIMHEYKLINPQYGPKERYWTICKIGKTGKSKVTVPEIIEESDESFYDANVNASEGIVYLGDQYT